VQGVQGTGDPQLGARLRDLRLEGGVALKVIAKRADISIAYLSEVERGRKLPAIDVLARIADALDTSLVELLRGIHPYDR
jgi:transcriptional regulator with XRE-family HTH domain